LQATAEANNLTVVAAAKETYSVSRNRVCGGAMPYLKSAHSLVENQRIKENSLNNFIKKCKMGGGTFSESYKERLD
jgi:atlastin